MVVNINNSTAQHLENKAVQNLIVATDLLHVVFPKSFHLIQNEPKWLKHLHRRKAVQNLSLVIQKSFSSEIY